MGTGITTIGGPNRTRTGTRPATTTHDIFISHTPVTVILVIRPIANHVRVNDYLFVWIVPQAITGPFPNVSEHIVKAPTVWFFVPNGMKVNGKHGMRTTP